MYRWFITLGFCCISVFSTQAFADEASDDTIVVGTRHTPPFAIKGNGDWSGITIDLVKQIATEQGLKIRFVEMGLDEMLDKTAAAEIDMAAAALTVTAERELLMDFTHPYLTSGLGIAVAKRDEITGFSTLQRIFSGPFLKAAGALLVLLTIVGVLIWLAERRRNEQFCEAPVRGIGAGLWWSAVTMTTVGYGDKAPVTLRGRVLGLIWMFASIIVISGFTAAIATSLTVGQLEQSISSIEDLYGEKVVTVRDSTSAHYLTERLIKHIDVDNVEQGLKMVSEGKAKAVVYDMPILQYQIKADYSEQLRVLPSVVVRQDYGIALPTKRGRREMLNQQILSLIDTPQWQQILDVYIGE
ncbi:transporter substrate-binding domain-containing protein [Corallincola platygyrae]|uniref:Transporter substrate-binding domain-containing protein n=1 Tax=Corallincola platygyrae TaxID=1193278 RepID=A0ABW4XNE4_9GAMM